MIRMQHELIDIIPNTMVLVNKEHLKQIAALPPKTKGVAIFTFRFINPLYIKKKLRIPNKTVFTFLIY